MCLIKHPAIKIRDSVATLEDLQKLDIRIGRIVSVEDVEKARKPIYKFTIDFGAEIGMRTILAGVKNFYTPDQLLNRQIACIVNLEPKVIAGIESQGMILAADDLGGDGMTMGVNGITILVPDKEVQSGSKVR